MLSLCNCLSGSTRIMWHLDTCDREEFKQISETIYNCIMCISHIEYKSIDSYVKIQCFVEFMYLKKRYKHFLEFDNFTSTLIFPRY